jgi:hypothetical protein
VSRAIVRVPKWNILCLVLNVIETQVNLSKFSFSTGAVEPYFSIPEYTNQVPNELIHCRPEKLADICVAERLSVSGIRA